MPDDGMQQREIQQGDTGTNLGRWKGSFGDEYTRRHLETIGSGRAGFFLDLMTRIRSGGGGGPWFSILEVGANKGNNLGALLRLPVPPGGQFGATGVEPNAYARSVAAQQYGITLVDGHAARLPFPDASFDLVFTCGVLMHVPLEGIADALNEIIRVSRRWILAIEYHADQERPVEYLDDVGLWARDTGMLYLTQGLGLALVDVGIPGVGFADYLSYYLLKKPS